MLQPLRRAPSHPHPPCAQISFFLSKSLLMRACSLTRSSIVPKSLISSSGLNRWPAEGSVGGGLRKNRDIFEFSLCPLHRFKSSPERHNVNGTRYTVHGARKNSCSSDSFPCALSRGPCATCFDWRGFGEGLPPPVPGAAEPGSSHLPVFLRVPGSARTSVRFPCHTQKNLAFPCSVAYFKV